MLVEGEGARPEAAAPSRLALPVASPSEVLSLAREQLEMDVAFIVEHTDGTAVVRLTDGDPASFGITLGHAVPLEETVSKLIVDGVMPNLVADTTTDPRVRGLQVTRARNVGAILGVPIAFSDGRVFGVLACAAHQPDASLRERDVKFLRILAAEVARELEHQEATTGQIRLETERIEGAIDGDVVSMVFQPIVTLKDRSVVGFEALARFAAEPVRGPDKWFAEAARVNLGVNLEILAVRAALARMHEVPPDVYLSVNTSLDTLLSPEFEAELAAVPAERIVVEISEHAQVEDYLPVLLAMETLRERGARFAIDDAGGGFDGLSHILQMRPDIIKLDTFLTRGIDQDPVRRAVATSLEVIGADVGAVLVAEGVETQAEIAQLRALGVEHGQGMRLGPPGLLPLSEGPPPV